jgi:hypothetical protein
MLLAVVVCALGLAVVLFAVYRDEPLEPPQPALPDWDPLPSPVEVAHGEFPLAFPGYDPASVEVYFDQLRRAYDDLYAVAPPEVIERARQRALLRAGRQFTDLTNEQRLDGPPELSPFDDVEDDPVRREAVLAAIDQPARRDHEGSRDERP